MGFTGRGVEGRGGFWPVSKSPLRSVLCQDKGQLDRRAGGRGTGGGRR